MREPLRVYLDTSVLGGAFDPEFARDTAPLLKQIAEGRVVALLSDVLAEEVSGAPSPIRDLLRDLLPASERLVVDEHARRLQHAYLAAGAVSAKYDDDAMHVALATVARADALASWNLRHMVDPRRSRIYNGINLAQGFGLLMIVTPVDLGPWPEEDDGTGSVA